MSTPGPSATHAALSADQLSPVLGAVKDCMRDELLSLCHPIYTQLEFGVNAVLACMLGGGGGGGGIKCAIRFCLFAGNCIYLFLNGLHVSEL